MAMAAANPVVLFDGVCNLCSASVQVIIDRDPQAQFRFASLQSEAGRKLLAELGCKVPEGEPESVLLIEDGKLFSHSEAALRIARRLHGPARLAAALRLLPHGLRDRAYRLVAKNRYRWFGKASSCRLPTPQLRARFLDQSETR
jgi:predicted DCC family thiol-disulfide oxidoreductase YuxK